ncbi:hypothetical protein C2E20_7701 [Micractinium conductrix]|uniref:Uncharacterized protein n=1 Tax=Micractinium conductrix TaxID=554055 RepID=A0A2P6V3Q3_9CHLO|nr:hypothetical protein C2E20_7701 [Micractinium conductrix]|eukprot:PSC68710.1 hypothetical protein C2E20_7701 [Micractinium conductrix]
MSFACAVRGDTAAVHAPAGPWPPSLRKEGEGPPPAKWKPWEVLLAVGAVASEGLTVLAEPEPAQQLLTQHRQRLYPCGAPAELPVLKRQRLENYAGPRDQQWQWQPTLLAPACGQPLLHAQHWRWQQQLATPPALPAAHAWTAAPPLWAQCNAQQPTAQHLAPPLVQAPLPPPVPVTPLGAAAQQFATRRTSSTSGSAQEGEASLADGTETSASVEGGGALPAALPHVTLPAELCRRMLRLLGLCMAALHAAAARDAAAAAPTRQHQASHVQPTAAPSVGGLPQRPAPGSAPGPAAAGISAGALDLLAAASRAQQARLASPLLDATSCAAHKQRLQLTPMQRVVLGVMAAARLEDRVSRRAPAIGGL